MSTYLITGASGYIGSMLVKRLLKTETDAKIIALVRSPRNMQETSSDRLHIFSADLCDASFPERFYEKYKMADYILHCASTTKSAEMIAHPVEVTEGIVNGTQNVLKLARRCDVRSMVYLSSMEVYGNMDCSDGHRVTEEEAGSGSLELLRTRSCYPLGKRMAENICCSYFEEYGVPVKIARLAQTFGSGILLSDNRVFAQFARSVREKTDIVLHTKGNSMGNYCAIDDTVSGILAILENGKNGEAYNVVNEANTMTIRQMAKLVASQIAGGEIGVRYEITGDNSHGYAPDTGLCLSGKKLTDLGWRPQKSLEDMYRDMLEDMH